MGAALFADTPGYGTEYSRVVAAPAYVYPALSCECLYTGVSLQIGPGISHLCLKEEKQKLIIYFIFVYNKQGHDCWAGPVRLIGADSLPSN